MFFLPVHLSLLSPRPLRPSSLSSLSFMARPWAVQHNYYFSVAYLFSALRTYSQLISSNKGKIIFDRNFLFYKEFAFDNSPFTNIWHIFLSLAQSFKNTILSFLSWRNSKKSKRACSSIRYISMTSLLTHNVAHSTRHSFRPKTNNQPLKKFLSLAFSCVKVVKNWTSF